MTTCLKCGKMFGDITESRQHDKICKENKTDEELGFIEPKKVEEPCHLNSD